MGVPWIGADVSTNATGSTYKIISVDSGRVRQSILAKPCVVDKSSPEDVAQDSQYAEGASQAQSQHGVLGRQQVIVQLGQAQHRLHTGQIPVRMTAANLDSCHDPRCSTRAAVHVRHNA